MFYKGKYHAGLIPFTDNLLNILNNEQNQTLCNNYYVKKLIELNNKYHLKYD
jgi:hypothetical protein